MAIMQININCMFRFVGLQYARESFKISFDKNRCRRFGFGEVKR